MPQTPIIPEYITVHLGSPDSNAQNVTLPFADYIKNVASSEIYPTWPESAIRANIYAQISFALNRVYTEYYRSRGYNFDITNDISRDQSFVYGRDVFESISQIVDEIFNSYVRVQGTVEPLFTAYCDGAEVICEGLSQWGTVDLAEEGLSPLEILQYYYGDNIEIVSGVPVAGFVPSVPPVTLRLGSAGNEVQLLQRRLNRISTNYPAIPKIYPADGIFAASTEEAVKAFQEIFNLTPDGIVGNATWYSIQRVYAAVKRLSDLNSEGLTFSEINTEYAGALGPGDTGTGVLAIQYFLRYIANFVGTVQSVALDGDYGPSTEAAVKSFQRTYGLTEDGIVGLITFDTLHNVYRGLVDSLDLTYREGVTVPYPGVPLTEGSEGDDVRLLQNYLNYVARSYPSIPTVPVTGFFGPQTTAAVNAFKETFSLPGEPGVVGATTWYFLTSIYEDLYLGNIAAEGQYPGAAVGGGA